MSCSFVRLAVVCRPVSVLVLLPFCIGKERKPELEMELDEARGCTRDPALTAAGMATRPRKMEDFEIIAA